MKILLSVGIAAFLFAGCNSGVKLDPQAKFSNPSVPLLVTTHAPPILRWASLQTHMRKHGYAIEKYDLGRGNAIVDLQGNTIGTTVFAFFPASMSDNDIQTVSGRHGVIYHLNLSAKVEMRSILFSNGKIAEAHKAKLMRAFSGYNWKDSPTKE